MYAIRSYYERGTADTDDDDLLENSCIHLRDCIKMYQGELRQFVVADLVTISYNFV